MLASIALTGLAATLLSSPADAWSFRDFKRQIYPPVSTAPGGMPETTGVAAGTSTATTAVTASTTSTTAGALVLPTPSVLGTFINATEYNSTNNPVVLNVSVNSGVRNKTAPLLYGWMIEDISHSVDGGIYAEMLTNRAFQGSTATTGTLPGVPGSSVVSAENPLVPFGPVISGWEGIGGVDLSLTLLHPLSDALPISLEMDIPWNATGEVGFFNTGWWGFDVKPGVYNASFYILANAARNNGSLTNINVSLRSNVTGKAWSTAAIPVGGTSGNISTFEYMQYNVQINSNMTAPDANNTFAITMNGTEVAGDTYYFALLSLFPETYANRPNGLRPDIASAIKDLGSKFLRFPGGNNLEGYSIEQRWKWNETIGPLKDRKGRVGDWSYFNTNGLGYLEYLEWCEDLELEPLLAVYAGYSLDIYGQAGASFPEDKMQLVLDDIFNELEYAMGNTSTTYGKMRADHGHAEAFDIKFIELGNEDFFSSTYPYRFPFLYNGIKEKYPNITLISTAYNENADYNISIPAGGMYDFHQYTEPTIFLKEFNKWDNWQEETNNTDVTVFVGEYSSFQYDTPDAQINYTLSNPAHIHFPNLIGALGEAVWLLGAERNPNVVKMSSYAPSLENLNFISWNPDLVSYTAMQNETILSVSYYLQKLFASYRGTESLTVSTVSGDFNPLWWVATIDDATNATYVKVVNTGNSSTPLTLQFDAAYSAVNGTILTANDTKAFNYLGNQTAVIPKPLMNLPALSAANQSTNFNWNVPAWSINVLQFDM